MVLVDNSFEQALKRRLRAELDGLKVGVPAVPDYSWRRSPKFPLAVARPLALAVAAALLLGSVAAFASGSPNPRVWVTEAQHSLGIQTPDQENTPGTAPTPHPSEHPDTEGSGAVPSGSRSEPGDKRTPEPVDHSSPEPADGSREGDG